MSERKGKPAADEAALAPLAGGRGPGEGRSPPGIEGAQAEESRVGKTGAALPNQPNHGYARPGTAPENASLVLPAAGSDDGLTLKTPDSPVPQAVVSRLSLYLRELQHLVRDGHETTSSNQLGSLLGFSDAQVRKDLAYFGHFGYPGIGYRCQELIAAIRRILGTDRGWPVVMVGTGNLGRALLGYKGFGHQNFRILAAFDIDANKVGARIDGIPVHHLDDLKQVVTRQQIKLAMIAVPAAAAQSVADQLVEAGIEGIVNFAPVTINLPPSVTHVGVDLAIELEQLTFAVMNRRS